MGDTAYEDNDQEFRILVSSLSIITPPIPSKNNYSENKPIVLVSLHCNYFVNDFEGERESERECTVHSVTVLQHFLHINPVPTTLTSFFSRPCLPHHPPRRHQPNPNNAVTDAAPISSSSIYVVLVSLVLFTNECLPLAARFV